MEKTFHSIEIINEYTIIKRIDKSLLNYGEIRIPNYLRDFFHFTEMEKHDRWDIIITYQGKAYEGVLYLDDYKRMRGKLRWGKDLTNILNQAGGRYIYPPDEETIAPQDIPLLRLQRINPKEYEADLIYPEFIEKDAQEYRLHEDKFIYGVKARFETDETIRLKVLKFHGTSCNICGFNYESAYGDLGRGYIEIHQITSLEKKEEDLDFEHDFIPICANCHGILHRKKKSELEATELKQIFHLRDVLRKTEKS